MIRAVESRPSLTRTRLRDPPAASARRASASSSAPASPLTPTAPTRCSPSNAATPPWKKVKNGSKLASSPGFALDLLRELARRARVASRRRVRLALRIQPRVGRRSVHRRGRDQLAVLLRDEDGDGAGRLAHDRLDDRQRLLELHRDTLRDCGDANRERNRNRDARLRLHGQGPLERVPRAPIAWPPPLVPKLVAIAGRNEEAVADVARPVRLRALDDRLARHRGRPGDRPVRQRRPEFAPRRADDRGGRGGQARALREAARPRRRRELRDLAARGGDRRQASLRLQLPLRAGGAARTGADRRGRARRDPALPRPLPPGLGRRPVPRHVALPGRRGRLGRARRPRHARHRPRPLPRRRDLDGLRARADVRAGPAGGRRARGRGRVRAAARSGRSRRRGSPSAGATRSSGRSTARRDRSRSTWSG